MSVALVVNGNVVATIAPGVTENPVHAALSALPWDVQARSASGITLASMTVRPGNVSFDPSGEQWQGMTERVRLRCGRLAFWAGLQIEGPAAPTNAYCR